MTLSPNPRFIIRRSSSTKLACIGETMRALYPPCVPVAATILSVQPLCRPALSCPCRPIGLQRCRASAVLPRRPVIFWASLTDSTRCMDVCRPWPRVQTWPIAICLRLVCPAMAIVRRLALVSSHISFVGRSICCISSTTTAPTV